MKLDALRGIGPRTREALGRLGIDSVESLLLHLPMRYEDRTRVRPLGDIAPGDSARFCVRIDDSRVGFGGRRSLLLRASDASGSVGLRLFHFRREQQERLRVGSWWLCWGEVRESRWGLECVHPQMQAVAGPETLPPLGDTLTPVYPSTAGLPQSRWQKLLDAALPRAAELFPELLPAAVAPPLAAAAALAQVHRPPASAPEVLEHARDRLAFEELLAQRLAVRRSRAKLQTRSAARCPEDAASAAALEAAFGFALTGAQRRVIGEIRADLARPQPMLRLVQGDVGCGKTAVAAAAAAQVTAAGLQVALMAPTEILARQHAATLARWFAPLGVSVALLVGGDGAAARRAALQAAASGEAAVVVGTQALFQEQVEFAALGLVIVDEQHRFGVGQRLALRDKRSGADGAAHQLIMTATPIPRTLAQTLYADLDISPIDELPPGRSPVETVAQPQSRRAKVIERLRVVCAQGRQAYWVCPALAESEHATAAEDIAALLREQLPELPSALLHGQLPAADKRALIDDFRGGALSILVATTVIEVGLDVPAASIIIIDEAERLGLAQLHQLRGRVGRGREQSYCVLLYKPPLSATAQSRLDALCTLHDGFALAEKDLELRGPGELLGTAQSGEQRLRFESALLDGRLLGAVEQAADVMLAEPAAPVPALIRRWLGERAEYASV